MSYVLGVINRLSSPDLATADRAAVMDAMRSYFQGNTASPAATPPAPASTGDVTDIVSAFSSRFPDLTPPEPGQRGTFFSQVLTAANGNAETGVAVLDIICQQRERGEWRDESFPAGLVFWFLKNKDHDKLRKQGYAIRRSREAAEAEQDAVENAPQRSANTEATPAPVAAFTPSGKGLDALEAAIGGIGKSL